MKIKAIIMLLVSVCVFAQSPNDSGLPSVSTFQGFTNRNFIGTDSFTGSEATMSPRFFRSGTPGDACGEFSSGNFQYKTYELQSSGAGELTVSFDPGACTTGIFVTFHDGSFNPSDICENYIWSFGSSQAFTETFSVPASSTIVMVVSGVANAPGVVCGPFSWEIAGTREVPTLGTTGLIILISLVGCIAIGFMVIRKRMA